MNADSFEFESSGNVPAVFLDEDEASLPSLTLFLDLLLADANPQNPLCLDDAECLTIAAWLGVHPKRNERSRLAVQKLLSHELPEVQAMACWASVQYDFVSRPSVRAILGLLQSPHRETRLAACESLGAVPFEKFRRHLSELRALCDDPDLEIASMASWVCARHKITSDIVTPGEGLDGVSVKNAPQLPASQSRLWRNCSWLLWSLTLRWMLPLGSALFSKRDMKRRK